MSGGIYGIRHIPTNRYYIGSAARIRRRWYAHLHRLKLGKHHSIKLQRAWDKYGPDAFEWLVVEPVQDEALLFEKEQNWIEHHQAHKSGFNMHPRAGGPRGHKFSEQIRAALSATRKGRKMRAPRTKEHLANLKLAASQRGLGWRAKLSAIASSPERLAALADRNRSAKMRAITAKRNRSPEMLAVVSRPKSTQHRAALSAAAKARWRNARQAELPGV
jgi:group I intron endonuclease